MQNQLYFIVVEDKEGFESKFNNDCVINKVKRGPQFGTNVIIGIDQIYREWKNSNPEIKVGMKEMCAELGLQQIPNSINSVQLTQTMIRIANKIKQTKQNIQQAEIPVLKSVDRNDFTT